MKTSKTFLVVLLTIILLSDCSRTNDAVPRKTLLADYSLLSDGKDRKGLNGAMTLTNAPFQNGGVYCNGIYDYSSGPNPCTALSPAIKWFNFKSFSIGADFLVSEKKTQPVWIIGTGCRWLGFYLNADGTIALLYNNINFLATQKTYSLNEWHNAQITYDGTTVKMFLDSVSAASIMVGDGNVKLDYATCGTSDTQIGVSNYSDGSVLNGYIKNLKVYSPQ